ncbi:MAG TPA: glycosyltransferase family 1 protein [Dehalococcoidia bacterium]|nr:glycosyltransferase family 1 protein [Dehalococcoidia bacterium]
MPRHLIAIDASGLSPKPTGSDRYTLNLVRALARVDDEHDYVVYARRFSLPDLAGLGSRFRIVEAGPWAPGGRHVWQQAGLALDLMRRRVRLLHSPNQSTPRMVPCRRVVTINDLAPLILPEEYEPARRSVLQQAVQRADAVLAPSDSLANEIVDLLGADEARIHVTYGGVDTTFRAMDPEQCANLVQDRYGLHAGYLLSVGAGMPSKNRATAFHTLRRLLDQGRDTHLAIIGDDGSLAQEATISDLGLRDQITYCGYVAQQDLPALYNSAAVLLHPALHDGLGLSVLEAMASGAPVVVTDRSTPPELTGDAGLVVDPTDVEANAAAVARVLDDSALATRMRFDGLKRASEFSWEACAERTVAVYRLVLGED